MGVLRQATAVVANSPKITINMWVNVPDVTGGAPLLEFGGAAFGGGDGVAANAIFLTNDGTLGNTLEVAFQGALNSLTDNNTYLTTTDEANDTYWLFATDSEFPQSWTPMFDGTVTGLGGAVAAGSWFHLLVAADFSNSCSLGGETNTFFIFVNGVKKTLSDPTKGGSGNLIGRIVNQATGEVQSALFGSSGRNYAPLNNVFSFQGDTIDAGDAYAGPFSWTRSISTPDGPQDATLTGIVPGWSLDLNAREIALPAQYAHASIGGTVRVKYGFVQIYVGQFIDPTNPDNLAKFVNLSGGHGTPQPLSTAEAAFGVPTYCFKGGADVQNTGTGGSFEKVGTINDATGPSF